MRIGVICEGPTDYPAISHFVGNALEVFGITAIFKPLFPSMDNTRPDGGWGNVLFWLANNPVATRVQRYFTGGLFGGTLSSDPLDAIVIQLDTDVIEDGIFTKYVFDHFNILIRPTDDVEGRADQIRAILREAAQLDLITHADEKRHVLIPATESTEAWCVAAFHARPLNAERLRGSELTCAFMAALERSESREPKENYSTVDKTFTRRQRFCQSHAVMSQRIMADCRQFELGVSHLAMLAA